MIFNKRSHDPYISGKINEALLCKMWGCRPSQIEGESAEDIETHLIIYQKMIKENPLF